jgi:hypothetical protein
MRWGPLWSSNRPAASRLFMRHTGQWGQLCIGKTVDDCIKAIKDDPWFVP